MGSRLAQYRTKRDFAATPEPAGRAAARASAPSPRKRFVVQLHHASSRHFDFRLQVGKTLRSWAIPKGPSLDPAAKRLAVEVEDHPLEYAGFEGTIPQGHYGAGEVHIWDHGRWAPDEDPAAALERGKLDFELFGQRLQGRWTLVRTRLSGRQPQWLLIKRRDAHVVAGDVADDEPLSRWKSRRRRRRA
jgi:bifunctional non-homologous end joining protein LigD